MASSINPINVNTQGLNAATGFGAKQSKAKEELKEPGVSVKSSEQAQVSADDVLNFMAQSAVSVAPAKTLDPSKYVDKESEARIAGFMADFEDIVATNLAAISEEFPAMSDGAKQTLALAQVKA